ncbi:MAG TPA: 50S ribosomal protein L20 [Candidatus Kapabacteria bacterium]|jgi:large subunit ribosomal protein L20|nr:50S ribosomal protein L20 [Candidatus Kapabacteria bacterium]HOV92372.1 50S ribosomal protein L20 [Candidatus Kapabacteria bacterium]
MARSKNKVASHRRRVRFIKLAKGYWGRRKNVWTVAKNHIEKGLTHAYVGRKLKKRNFRRLWITRINAAARENGTTYSKLIYDLRKNNIIINRKVLAYFAMNKPEVFKAIVQKVS